MQWWQRRSVAEVKTALKILSLHSGMQQFSFIPLNDHRICPGRSLLANIACEQRYQSQQSGNSNKHDGTGEPGKVIKLGFAIVL
jgi:hypothetical protein